MQTIKNLQFLGTQFSHVHMTILRIIVICSPTNFWHSKEIGEIDLQASESIMLLTFYWSAPRSIYSWTDWRLPLTIYKSSIFKFAQLIYPPPTS